MSDTVDYNEIIINLKTIPNLYNIKFDLLNRGISGVQIYEHNPPNRILIRDKEARNMGLSQMAFTTQYGKESEYIKDLKFNQIINNNKGCILSNKTQNHKKGESSFSSSFNLIFMWKASSFGEVYSTFKYLTCPGLFVFPIVIKETEDTNINHPYSFGMLTVQEIQDITFEFEKIYPNENHQFFTKDFSNDKFYSMIYSINRKKR
jgi:hypothetical protein